MRVLQTEERCDPILVPMAALAELKTNLNLVACKYRPGFLYLASCIDETFYPDVPAMQVTRQTARVIAVLCALHKALSASTTRPRRYVSTVTWIIKVSASLILFILSFGRRSGLQRSEWYFRLFPSGLTMPNFDLLNTADTLRCSSTASRRLKLS